MSLILNSIKGLPQRTQFQLEDFSWFHNLNKSNKIALGRAFCAKVKNGDIPNVIYVGKDVTNHSIYKVI